jgi:outer membrane receptor protein involved in Fe transport
MDAGFSYKMMVGKDNTNSVNFRLNINNVLDKTYIAESRTNIALKTQQDYLNSDGTPNTASYQNYLNTQVYDGVDTRNQVFFGFGRTWNFTLSYSF